LFFLSLLPPLPCSPLFPYTTLFRSLLPLPLGSIRPKIGRTLNLMREPAHPAFSSKLQLISRVRTISALTTNSRTFRCMGRWYMRSEEHTSELQSRFDLVCRLLLEKK